MPRTRPSDDPEASGVAGRWQRLNVNPEMSGRWKAGLTALGVLLVLAVCGIGSYLIVLDEQQGVQAQANSTGPKPTAIDVDISSRKVDSVPLTVAEVFPGKKIVIDHNRPTEAYTLLATQLQTDCRVATNGEITKLIAGLGCSQVVRGTMLSPNKAYLVTGGILNLDTVEGAEKAWDMIKPQVDGGKGRFLGYAPDSKSKNSKTRPLALASTHAGWNIKGHYLVYTVIARADGAEIPNGDPFAKQILYDVIEFYLKGTVLAARATDPIPGNGSAAPGATGAKP